MMMHFVCCYTDGNLTAWGQCQDENLALMALPGTTAMAGEGTEDTHFVEGGNLLPYTEAQAQAKASRPPHPCRWDNALMAWVDLRDLTALRADKWDQIKQARDAALAAPLATPFGLFDADEKGSANIVKSVLLANNLTALGYPAEIDFTLADNTVTMLDAPAMVQVGLLLAAREQQLRAQATSLREQIANSAASALPNITWN